MNQNSNEPKSSSLRSKLQEAHDLLLVIHKAMLDFERARYEQVYGPMKTPGEVLQRVISDPWFAWLRSLSALIVEIDEVASADEPFDVARAGALGAQARQLLTPDENGGAFQREYFRVIQASPEVALMQGPWRRVVQGLEDGAKGGA